MKPRGRHPHQELTAAAVKTRSPGRYADGNGLYLVVDPSGARRWMLRIIVRGRRRDMGLGGTQLVSLAQARETARDYRKIARSGGDPLAHRQSQAAIPTFAEAATRVHQSHEASWRNGKHKSQWITTLEKYAFPYIGTVRVDQIDTPLVLSVLSPIWVTKAETARRVRQRMKTVLDWAKASGFRSGENPIDGVSKGLPKQSAQRGHFSALPFRETAAFVKEVHSSNCGTSVQLALEFLILTATRTSEVLGLRWTEIDEAMWTLPANRTKPKREFQIPLCPRACEILTQARALSGENEYVFPGQSVGRPLSNMALLMAVRRMRPDITVHGFRSTFTDWAHEETNFTRVVIEKALNHAIKDKTEGAYRRGELFDKRKDLMLAWEQFVTAGRATADSEQPELVTRASG
jgi:integrase